MIQVHYYGDVAVVFHATKDREIAFCTASRGDDVWREALLFVALAKLGRVFRLIAEMRYWATLGALPAPFDRLGITQLGQLGADVWPACETCDGDGLRRQDCTDIGLGHLVFICNVCDVLGPGREPTRVDDALTDWLMEHGKTWAEVLPRFERNSIRHACHMCDAPCERGTAIEPVGHTFWFCCWACLEACSPTYARSRYEIYGRNFEIDGLAE